MVYLGPCSSPRTVTFVHSPRSKAGFIDFRLSPNLIPYSSVVSSVLGIRTSSFNAALYPGGGVEATLGPVGLRLELGDAIYFNGGAHNNLRTTFGPIIRF